MKTKTIKEEFHEPVLVDAVIRYLEPTSSKKFIDATLGSGGHSLELIAKGAHVLGIDQDEIILKTAEARLTTICPERDCFKLYHGNFRKIDEIASAEGFYPADGILFDLGVSNIHLTDPERGFSFTNPEAELDMRVDPKTQSVKASDLLNVLRQDQLRNMFEAVMDKGSSLWLTKKIIRAREKSPFKNVGDILGVTQGIRSKPGLNPATLPMLALRIAVGSELENLREALPKALETLTRGGRMIVISFHSSEERVVNEFFKQWQAKKEATVLTKDPIVADEEEVRANPRSRSAKMRVLEKI
ncbi:16S rRNA (cytosine(1402)-N(4))-methyltransferase RsmH [Candidatus Woesebacteria bacterium]|nr:16S rRNA (cytosine(1402)-N(4))-methyltransferase RsmH [Candidatus Woesebacteria bacterium]